MKNISCSIPTFALFFLTIFSFGQDQVTTDIFGKVLDDLGAIQNSFNTANTLKIVQPKPSYRIFGGYQEKPRPGLGQNPKSGVTLDYYLPEKLDSTVLTLEVLQNGNIIRTYTNQKPKDFKSWPGGPPRPQVLPSKKGYNRFTWDLRKEAIPAVDKVFVFGNYQGARVAPGTYTLRLSMEDASVETTAKVLANPKIKASEADYNDQQMVLNQIEDALSSMHKAVNQMRSAKNQLKSYKKLLKDNEAAKELLAKGDSLTKRITTWEEHLIQPKQKTFQDVINFHNQLNADFMHLKGFVDVAEPQVTQGAKERLQDLLRAWSTYEKEKNAIVETEMNTYNTMYKALGIPALILSDN